ncbi:MAG: RNA polymerase sigma factor SigJ [Beutenbergiaceae bacterium]
MSAFDDARPRLFGIAYRIVGSFSDAEDVVQETWLAWQRVDRDVVRNPIAYLTTAVTRQALNQVRAVQRRREDYIGQWLPEPVATEHLPEESAEIADSVTFAMMVMLERLSPTERAAFVLCEVFGLTAAEAGAALEKSPAAVRQLTSRARSHLAVDTVRNQVDRQAHLRTAEAFIEAIQQGNVVSAIGLLSPQVTLIADGGGKVNSARRPISGRMKVVRFLLGSAAKFGVSSLKLTDINRLPAAVITSPDGTVSIFQLRVTDGVIDRFWVSRNPDKLGAIPL